MIQSCAVIARPNITWYCIFHHSVWGRTHIKVLKHDRHPTWWRHQMETFSALLAICAGNSPVPGDFPAQRPVTRSFDVFFDLCLNKRLGKQSWGWWFETLSHPLWRPRNDTRPWLASYVVPIVKIWGRLSRLNLHRCTGWWIKLENASCCYSAVSEPTDDESVAHCTLHYFFETVMHILQVRTL